MGIASTAAEVRGLVDGPINRAAARVVASRRPGITADSAHAAVGSASAAALIIKLTGACGITGPRTLERAVSDSVGGKNTADVDADQRGGEFEES